MSNPWFPWWRRPVPETSRPEAPTIAEPRAVAVSEIRRGDRFAEEFLGQTLIYLALEDAHPWRSATQPPGHRFRALGDRGPQEFYCATGWESYGPQLYRLPPEEAGDGRVERVPCRHGWPRDRSGAGPADRARMAGTPSPGPTPKAAATAILIIAQNPVWLAGLRVTCEGLGTVAGWTVRDWLEHGPDRLPGGGPQVVVHHRGDGPAGETDCHSRIGEGLRRCWPALKWVTISDAPRTAGPEAGHWLPQACAPETLRAAVRAQLAAA